MSTSHPSRHARPVRGLRHRTSLLALATLTSLAALVALGVDTVRRPRA